VDSTESRIISPTADQSEGWVMDGKKTYSTEEMPTEYSREGRGTRGHSSFSLNKRKIKGIKLKFKAEAKKREE
jgi:hypothetical protein